MLFGLYCLHLKMLKCAAKSISSACPMLLLILVDGNGTKDTSEDLVFASNFAFTGRLVLLILFTMQKLLLEAV